MARSLRVEADGGSRGNPGVAGYGALVRDAASGGLLVELAAPLGRASNNVAEYRGMLAGLRAAARIDPGARVEVRMDSKLVVEQMSGRWRIKHEDMQALAAQARDVVAGIEDAGGSVDFTWIPRSENAAADALSNRGMDGEQVDDWHEERSAPTGEERSGTPGEDRTAPTRVVLVRHGVTPLTERACLDGRGGVDPSLSATGRAQAERAADLVAELVGQEQVSVLTSSLARAKETGAAVADRLGVAAQVDARWDEQAFGDWDGRAMKDLLEESREDFLALRDDPTFARPGGESHEELATRVVQAWRDAIAAGGTVVVACHRKPVLVVLAHVLDLPHESFWRLAGEPGSLTAIEARPDGRAVVTFTNRT